jgi:chemotaxis signal transduction protein
MQTYTPQITEWSEHFALLVFEDMKLLIPQTDIYSLEPVADMLPASDKQLNSVGEINQGGQVWPVYALSTDLNALNSIPKSSRIIILMKNVQPEYGLLCDQVDTIKRSEISIHPVPAAVQGKNSPLLAIAIQDSQVRYISSASALNGLFLL